VDSLLKAVGPVFVASFALQQLLELLDPVLDAIIQNHKKWILSVISFFGGLALALGLQLRILTPLGVICSNLSATRSKKFEHASH
jgi:hypothetical protein